MTFKGPMYPFGVEMFVTIKKILKKRAQDPKIVETYFIGDFQGPTYPFGVKIFNFMMFVTF